ncbi:MAG: T9SS type A sorting domain-containing protein [Saprospiraceae bacterium]|nr:T9SS type A sorting domain-containing protein [Saprospiraceae bacterium]
MKRLYPLFIIFWASVVSSQSFEFIETNPFNIQLINFMDSSKVALKYDFIDTDKDGDLDLNLMGLGESDSISASQIYNLKFFMEYQENIGTRNVPLFNARENRFSNFSFPKGKGFMIPSSADLNGDGYVDFVVSSEVDLYDSQYLQFQMSDGNGGFVVTNCLDWGLDPFPAYSFLMPKLTDLDHDGDFDILLGGYRRGYDQNNEAIDIPVYFYAKNTGNASQPKFLGWFENPYGLVPITGQSFFTTGDIDMDGDIDLLTFDVNEDDVTIVHYIQNIAGPGQKPRFAAPVVSPFGLPVAGLETVFIFPELADIDTDGDLDLFFMYITDEITELRYYRNNMCVPDGDIIRVSLCQGEVYQYENQTFSVAGDYYIQKENDQGCITVVHLMIEIIPDIQVIVQQNGNVLSAPDVSGYTYRWFDCTTGLIIDMAISKVFTPTYSGLFAVEVTDNSGCKHISDCVSVIIIGTDEIITKIQVQISPNPCDGILRIHHNHSKPVSNVRIYSIDGACVFEGIERDNSVDLSGINNGLYLIRFDFGQEVVVKRVVIQK